MNTEKLNIINKEETELRQKLMSKYKVVNRIDWATLGCVCGLTQEIILTPHSDLFNEAIKKIIDCKVNQKGSVCTSYDYVMLYKGDELIDKVEMLYGSLALTFKEKQ